MSHIERQREIVDRRALLAALVALAGQAGGEPPRAQVVEILRQALQTGRAEVRRRFDAGASGTDTVRGLSFLMDQLIRVLYDFVAAHVYPLANPTSGERLTLVAVGGYGRGELAPFSDIDLLFLLPYKPTPHTEQVVEYMLYALWDLGLKVGQATRSVEDTLRHAKTDLTIRTAVLEARYIWGDQELFADLKRRFEVEIIKGTAAEYVRAKLAERDERHARMGDSRYVVEPNVKEGKGGLRDLHTLFWIAKYIYRVDDVEKLVDQEVLSTKEAHRFARAQDFLWTVRCHLHFLTERAEDRLTFDRQSEVGRRMRYTDHAGTRGVERFMKHYFLIAKDVGDLTRIFCAQLEAEQERRPRFNWKPWIPRKRSIAGFAVDAGRLDVAKESAFKDDPVTLLRLFHVAQEHGLDIHPHALRLITQSLKLIDAKLRANAEANRLFMEMLTSTKAPEITLRRMNEAGVFGRFVPDFGRVVAQMQYDMYHVHTVDEHTLFAIGILSRIEKGEFKDEHPLSTAVVGTVVSRRALYLAVLLHDIAKGRGGDHSVLGEEVALKLCPRLGLTSEETEQVAWLVRWHLLMSNTAFKRDIDDPKTIQDFVEQVQSPERLKLLLVLTVADIRAVGPKTWNGWKAALLRELYSRAVDVMSGGLVAEARDRRIAAAQDVARQLLPEFSAEDFTNFVARGYPFYWLSFDAATHARHARLMREAERRGAAHTVIEVNGRDRPGLLFEVTRALTGINLQISSAKISTYGEKVVDVFYVKNIFGLKVEHEGKLKEIRETLLAVLAERDEATQGSGRSKLRATVAA